MVGKSKGLLHEEKQQKLTRMVDGRHRVDVEISKCKCSIGDILTMQRKSTNRRGGIVVVFIGGEVIVVYFIGGEGFPLEGMKGDKPMEGDRTERTVRLKWVRC